MAASALLLAAAVFNPACAFCLFVIKKIESLLPTNVTECDAFTKIYGPRLEKVLGNQLGGRHVCETAELCVPQQKMELLGKERCTWGPRYWCMDAQTAHRCGVSSCQNTRRDVLGLLN
ncbi:unnamed protein product [Tetraodon nigroviridis]|uniref:(spotted green pufferfish) hypothetical protein n=1 Tax=Tetraodon nigroviridis TaxID=99883 RepID=Q4RT17_TETNG|nr:unnamed protein product [Tetraodon nigroviridis]